MLIPKEAFSTQWRFVMIAKPHRNLRWNQHMAPYKGIFNGRLAFLGYIADYTGSLATFLWFLAFETTAASWSILCLAAGGITVGIWIGSRLLRYLFAGTGEDPTLGTPL